MPVSNDRGIQKKIETFWQDTVVNSLKPKKGSVLTILDIACGHGYATKQLAEALQQEPSMFYALDLARVSFNLPAASPHKLEVLSETPLQAFNQEVDLVVSNFGIEYLPLDVSLNQIDEILISGGKLAFNLHHPDSLISKNSGNEQSALLSWFNDEQLTELEVRLTDSFTMRVAQSYLLRLQQLNNAAQGFLANSGLPDTIVQSLGVAQRQNKGTQFERIKMIYRDYVVRLEEQKRAAFVAQELALRLEQNSDYAIQLAALLHHNEYGIISQTLIATKK
ncbi:hypothetical protein CWI71_05575 [Pseudidiomarina insulisalsae]|uniref:Methyltransferase type 11 domain-containing protein n=1 Tax=Pseudidiomarina insulisalsae TaxID=575789 RepID=A0A432YLL3_9GAMM|nr:hypothetical protein CWI71_05575 [Pseudidiomarina insulisalsae]